MIKNILIFLCILSSTNSFCEVLDSKDIIEVAQREYIFTDSVEHKYIQTYGVFTCVAVVISGEGTRASLAHFDAGTKIDQALSWMLRDYSKLEKLKISIYGGQPPFKLEENILKNLYLRGLEVISVNRNKSKNHSKSIIVNVKSGEVSNYRETVSSTDWQVAGAKVNRLKFGRSIYRHENSIGGGDIIEVMENSSRSIFGF